MIRARALGRREVSHGDACHRHGQTEISVFSPPHPAQYDVQDYSGAPKTSKPVPQPLSLISYDDTFKLPYKLGLENPAVQQKPSNQAGYGDHVLLLTQHKVAIN